ncbi:hypothetical protein X975_14816, partial [Stegodyphus mimosarum]
MSPFIINKYVVAAIGEPKNMKKLRSGDLLVETKSAQQTCALYNLKSIGTLTVSVSPHNTLNFSRGVISEQDLIDVSTEDIVTELKDQNVRSAKRIRIGREGQFINTKHIILTFNSPDLPSSIKAGYLHCRVRPYVPNP